MKDNSFPFEKVESWILKNRALLRLEGFSLNEPDNTAFVLEVLRKASKLDTYDVDKGIIQCWNLDEKRSIGDIFLICKYHRSNITLKDVYESLIQLCHNGDIGSWICGSLHKRVYSTYLRTQGFCSGAFDEYNFDFSDEHLPYHGSMYGDSHSKSSLNMVNYG